MCFQSKIFQLVLDKVNKSLTSPEICIFFQLYFLGCDIWYHCNCTGMNPDAYELLKGEDTACWACDLCVFKKSIPCLRVKSNHEENSLI